MSDTHVRQTSMCQTYTHSLPAPGSVRGPQAERQCFNRWYLLRESWWIVFKQACVTVPVICVLSFPRLLFCTLPFWLLALGRTCPPFTSSTGHMRLCSRTVEFVLKPRLFTENDDDDVIAKRIHSTYFIFVFFCAQFNTSTYEMRHLLIFTDAGFLREKEKM